MIFSFTKVKKKNVQFEGKMSKLIWQRRGRTEERAGEKAEGIVVLDVSIILIG